MKRLLVAIALAIALAAVAVPVVLAANPPTQPTSWSQIKCMWNPRCKGNG